MKAKRKIPRKLKLALCIMAAIIFAAGFVLSLYTVSVQFAPLTLSINLSETYQEMDGFGASGCWTFQEIGKDEQAAKNAAQLLYGDDGMKLNILRYNIGAGSVETDHGYEEDTRPTESFFISENYKSKESFSDPANYDFTRDKNAMRVLDECLKTGNIKTVTLFANSPHYLLTKNGKAHSDTKHTDNLPEENFEAFSDYLLIIADFFRQKFSSLENPPKIYISPVNEPQWSWGGKTVVQEGCHYEPKTLAKFLDVFYRKLQAYNKEHGAEIAPDFFDCGGYTDKSKYKKYISEMKKYPYFDELESLSFHSYEGKNKRLGRKIFSSYSDKKLKGKAYRMSEFCEMRLGTSFKIERGLHTAGVIMKDLTILSATEWSWWLGASHYGFEDGLIYYEPENLAEFTCTKRYYCMAQFSRYISAGDLRVMVTKTDFLNFDGTESCAFLKPDGSVVLVIINERSVARNLKLGGFTVENMIYTDAKNNLKEIKPDGNVKISAKSVTTLILKKA